MTEATVSIIAFVSTLLTVFGTILATWIKTRKSGPDQQAILADMSEVVTGQMTEWNTNLYERATVCESSLAVLTARLNAYRKLYGELPILDDDEDYDEIT